MYSNDAFRRPGSGRSGHVLDQRMPLMRMYSGDHARPPSGWIALRGRALGVVAAFIALGLILFLSAGKFATNSTNEQPVNLGGVGTSGAAQCRGGRSFHVAPSGTPEGTGTSDQPLDLRTALSEKGPAKPCDTIWLRGGTYRGTFTSTISGTEGAPIVVRPRPGERATIDSAPSIDPAIMINGNHVWLWGIEVTNSDPNRLSAEAVAWPSDLQRGTGVVTRGSDVKLINLVIHDLARGIEVTGDAFGGPSPRPPEIYGSLIYNNGFDGPQVSVGNGIQTQNTGAQHVIADNIIFNQYSHGIIALSAPPGRVDNIAMVGNVLFNNGLPGRSGLARDIFVSGPEPAMNLVLRDNATYGGAQTYIGHGNGCTNAVVTGNYFVGSTPLLLEKCTASVKDNHLHGQYGISALNQQYPQNTYYTDRPKGVAVRYRRNSHEPGRAHVIVYNWDKHPAVTVDLAEAGVNRGEQYEIRDAQNYYGEPLVARTLVGDTKVNFPMERLSTAAPIGRPGIWPTPPRSLLYSSCRRCRRGPPPAANKLHTIAHPALRTRSDGQRQLWTSKQ